MSRRNLLVQAASGAAVAAAAGLGEGMAAEAESGPGPGQLKGRIRQSVCRWCYGRIPLEKLAEESARMGIKGMDLVGKDEWPVLKKYGLICTMVPSHGIGKGFNRKENHDECVAVVSKAIEAAAEALFPNVICFSGNRGGMADDVGAENCAIGLKKVAGLAEQKKVTLCLELLNSKEHRDYMCDRTAWGVEVCKKVGSERVKLLYDIYHMQRMEGDIINTIRQNIQYIGHFHTAGNPGRGEMDENQELNYPAIMRAIADAKFDGYVGQEFIPKRDPLKSLAEAVRLCDV